MKREINPWKKVPKYRHKYEYSELLDTTLLSISIHWSKKYDQWELEGTKRTYNSVVQIHVGFCLDEGYNQDDLEKAQEKACEILLNSTDYLIINHTPPKKRRIDVW